MQWIVDTYLKPYYQAGGFGNFMGPELKPHFHYVLAGAASIMFAVAPECRRLTGVDPDTTEAIERHADFVAGAARPVGASPITGPAGPGSRGTGSAGP